MNNYVAKKSDGNRCLLTNKKYVHDMQQTKQDTKINNVTSSVQKIFLCEFICLGKEKVQE